MRMMCGSVSMKISFEGVESRTFEPLPVAGHDVKVTGAQFNAQSQSNQEPFIAWEFTVDGGEYDGRKAFHNTSLQLQALWSTQRTLMALGMTKEEVDELNWDTDNPETIQSDLDKLVDEERECRVRIGHRKFEGETRQQVRNVQPRVATD
jgi:hypothetical protein